jgi:hypothetical protein
MNTSVIRRSIEEFSVAQAANSQSWDASMTANVTRYNYEAMSAADQAEQAWLKVKPLVPEARAQLLEVRRWTAVAQRHASHAQQVLANIEAIPRAAIEAAREATLGWIASDAAKTAEATAANPNAQAAKEDKIANAVAGAAEPYHLALLRNQKFCEETYAKAKSAFSSTQKLIQDAKDLALKAQTLQASGMGLEAQETYSMATGMMNQAEELRLWSVKMYEQANKACGTSAGYVAEEQQAAANKAATIIINAPMELPERV